MDPREELAATFLRDKKVLIVEEQSPLAASISKVFIELGVKVNNIKKAKTFKEACGYIQKLKPQVIFCDYLIDSQCTMELVNMHRRIIRKRSHRLFLMASTNGSDSVVANIAEGDVDGFLLKPFSGGQVKDEVMKVANEKVKPSFYMGAIDIALALFDRGDFEDAEDSFIDATESDDKPCLALFYAGVAAEAQDELDRALSHYMKGLEYDEAHYKCAYGAFGIHFRRDNYKDAHEISQQLAKHYPVTPQRLSEIFMLAVFTKNTHELETLFDQYKEFEHQPEGLDNVVRAGFYAAGRLEIVKENPESSIRHFKSGIKAAGAENEYVEKVFSRLSEANYEDAALELLKSIPVTTESKKQIDQLEMMITIHSMTPEQVIARGQKLVIEGSANEFVYRELIKSCFQAGRDMLAENFIARAKQDYPDLEPELRELFKTAA